MIRYLFFVIDFITPLSMTRLIKNRKYQKFIKVDTLYSSFSDSSLNLKINSVEARYYIQRLYQLFDCDKPTLGKYRFTPMR